MDIARSTVGSDDLPGVHRSRFLDAALVGVVALVGLLILLGAPSTSGYRDPDALAAVLVVASAATMWWWRSAPRAALVIGCGLVVTNAVVGYMVGVVQYPVYFALYSVFARSSVKDRLWAVLAAAAAAGGYAVADRGKFDPLTLVGVGMTILVAALLGDGVRSRRELAFPNAPRWSCTIVSTRRRWNDWCSRNVPASPESCTTLSAMRST